MGPGHLSAAMVIFLYPLAFSLPKAERLVFCGYVAATAPPVRSLCFEICRELTCHVSTLILAGFMNVEWLRLRLLCFTFQEAILLLFIAQPSSDLPSPLKFDLSNLYGTPFSSTDFLTSLSLSILI